jgi:hypothetical protein
MGWDFTLPFQITLCPRVLKSIQRMLVHECGGGEEEVLLAYHLVTSWQRENHKVPTPNKSLAFTIQVEYINIQSGWEGGDLPILLASGGAPPPPPPKPPPTPPPPPPGGGRPPPPTHFACIQHPPKILKKFGFETSNPTPKIFKIFGFGPKY